MKILQKLIKFIKNMNNKFTRSGMAHLNPFSKKKKEAPEVKQVPIRRGAMMGEPGIDWGAIHRAHPQDPVLQYDDWKQMRLRNAGIRVVDHRGQTIFEGNQSSSEVKEIKPHIVRTKDPVGYQHTRGFTGNHQHVRYQYDKGTSGNDKNYGQLSISDSIGGCGMQQLYSWTNTSSEEIADMLVASMLKDVHYHTGVILCQVGMNYYGHPMTKALEKAGFTISLEYINYTHGLNGKYTQRVYQYVVPDKSEEEEEYDEDEDEDYEED